MQSVSAQTLLLCGTHSNSNKFVARTQEEEAEEAELQKLKAEMAM